MPSYGPYTQADLCEVETILHTDPTQYDRDAGRFALELAAAAYTFELEPWLNAGFTDITLQVEKRLMSGIRAGEEATFRQNMRNNFSQMLARHVTNTQNPLSQVRGLIMKVWESESGKALVMLRPLENGRILVAIGFAGTGRKLYDWIPNFRFAKQEGFHGGFYSVAKQFMDNADKIVFPSLGENDGRPLSLVDIIEDAKKPDSRFFLFAAGHSQGSAVLQIWLHLLSMQGVQKQNMLGYGFAAPSVCGDDLASPGLPVILIANSDDVVARVGLSRHFGTQYVYRVDDVFIEKCYGSLIEDPLYQLIRHTLNDIAGTKEALLTVLAHIYALSYMDEEDAAPLIKAFLPFAMPDAANQSAHSLICLSRRYCRQTYQDLFGEPDRKALLALAKKYYFTIKKEPGYAATMVKALWMPHHLYLPDSLAPQMAAYAYIAVRGYPELVAVTDPD